MHSYRYLFFLLLWPALSSGEELGPGGKSDLGGVVNYYEYSSQLSSAGQPTAEQLPVIAAAGFDAVINLSAADDPRVPAGEAALVGELGMDYVRIPVNWLDPPMADLDSFFAAMNRLQGKRVLVHCFVNARASTFTYLWRTLKAGDEDDEARATMIKIWAMTEGNSFDQWPVWKQFVADAQVANPH